MIAIAEEHALELMWSATAFSCPMLAAVDGVNDCSFGADGPAFKFVDKLHVKQIDIDFRLLSLPGATTVRRSIDAAATAYGPSSAIINKRSGSEPNFFSPLRQRRLIPCVAAVGGLNDCGAGAYQPATIVVDEDATQK